jgi:uncharacterized protein
MRTLLIVLAVVAIALIARFLLRQRRLARPTRVTGGDMVRCAHCGLHVPAAEALSADGRWYCCEAHRAAGADGRRG